MSTHNIGFYEDLTKIIFELSSNTHLISSAARNCEQERNLSDFYDAQANLQQKPARVWKLLIWKENIVNNKDTE